MAFQEQLDPIIAYTQGQVAPAESVSREVVATEDFAFVVDASVSATD